MHILNRSIRLIRDMSGVISGRVTNCVNASDSQVGFSTKMKPQLEQRKRRAVYFFLTNALANSVVIPLQILQEMFVKFLCVS